MYIDQVVSTLPLQQDLLSFTKHHIMTMSNPPTRQDRSTHPLVSLSDIEAAAERISSRVIQTPLLTNQSIDRAVSLAIGGNEDIDVRIAFKAEHLQVVG